MGLAYASLALVFCANLAACGPHLPKSVDQAALEQAVASRMGDVNTCVVMAERATGRIAWTTGLTSACSAKYPACTSDKAIDVRDLAKTAAGGALVTTGCGTVSWAAGPVGGSKYVYAAVMSGERALPGREIALRLDRIFRDAGL